MKSKPNLSIAAAELRSRAEARLHERPRTRRSAAGVRESDADTQRLLQELQVHQVELEMQNAELKEARNRLETLLERYTDLYDFAPVGYFSLAESGRILEVNLTGAALLDVERSRLVNQPLQRFVAPANRPIFLDFLQRVLAGAGKEVWEATLQKKDGAPFWASFHGTCAMSVTGAARLCRVAVSDITALKEAEEAQRRMDALALSNRELRREIVRRQAVEAALKESEQHQSRLLEQSRHMQAQLRKLSHQVLQAQEKERKRISRELHDEIAQTLVGINMHLETLVREATLHPERLREAITRTQRLVTKSVNIVAEFARRLRPTVLDNLGLIPALKAVMKDFTKRTGIQVRFTAFAGVEKMSNAKRTVFYRIVQSALANVTQHARAKAVKVTIQKQGDAVLLEIQDDGKGFEVEPVLFARGRRRLGLLGMRERVEMVGGSFHVESAPGRGTILRAQVAFAGGRKATAC